jgi:hypothetical protein
MTADTPDSRPVSPPSELDESPEADDEAANQWQAMYPNVSYAARVAVRLWNRVIVAEHAARAAPQADDVETEPCPTCWQPVPVPQRGDHDYGIPLRAAPQADAGTLRWSDVRKEITDSYYDTRNEGGTMEKAADLAATRVMSLRSQADTKALNGDTAALKLLVGKTPGAADWLRPVTITDIERALASACQGLREAAQEFIDWFDSPGRSYRRDGEGSAVVAGLRVALAASSPATAGREE